jgi:hypothetical protein
VFFDNFIIEDEEETLVFNQSDISMMTLFHVLHGTNIREMKLSESLHRNPYSAVYRVKKGQDHNRVMDEMVKVYGAGMAMRF